MPSGSSPGSPYVGGPPSYPASPGQAEIDRLERERQEKARREAEERQRKAQADADAKAKSEKDAKDAYEAGHLVTRTGSGGGLVTPGSPEFTPIDTHLYSDPIMQEMENFKNYMMKPLDFNDPYVKGIMQTVQNKAESAARLRGIGGPMSISNSQAMMTNAAAQLQMQKQAQAADMMKSLSGRDLSLQDLAWNKEQFDLNAKNALALQQYQNNQSTGSTWGSIIGTGLGLGAGFALAPFTGGLSIPLSLGLAGLGGGLGGGAGAAIGGASGVPQPYTPIRNGYGYGYGRSGGLSSGY